MNTSKHHGKIRGISAFAALLFLCVGVQSCKDPYLLDDMEPDWLGASIYDYMQEQGNFTYFLKVIDDLNYTDVLSKTGSKTLFAANDEAFMKGIKNAWGVNSYEQLSEAQKKVILYNSMLDNAYLLEMMSSSAASSTNAEPQEGRCLRQVTSANVVDTIGYYAGADLPQNNMFWDRYREKGIRLALDGTSYLMVHFLEEQLYQNNITLEDLKILFNHRYDSEIKSSDAFIFDKRVTKQNITCKNGYIHELDGLLIPPSNMAEEIRRNPKTQLFSRLLDRFAVPVYNAQLSSDYNRLNHYGDDANSERVYEKRYFTSTRDRNTAADANSGFLSFTDDDQRLRTTKGSLYFDPGWNSFTSGTGGSVEADMGAMFVPNDETLTQYFTTGQGKPLIERYGVRADGTRCATLVESMDSIPLDVIQALLRNVMKSTFIATVPSKFESIMNDARESMHIEKEHIDECMITNNGVVYVTKAVYSPARYVAVIAPVMLSEATRVAYWAINQYEYDKYLLAMDSYFSLIVPSDNAMRYNDVASLKEPTPTCYFFHYDPTARTEAAKVYADTWTYDRQTGELLTEGTKLTNGGQIKNLLEQMMEYYIIVGDFQDGNKYHMAKGYGTVKVAYNGTETRVRNGIPEEVPVVERVYGGHELEIDTIPGGPDTGVAIGETYHQENGNTYRLDDAMIQPATQSVYKVLSDSIRHEDFYEFYTLCGVSNDVVELVGVRNDKGQLDPDSTKKFLIFENVGGLDYNIHTFNTYHYTVYVPTNDAIYKAYEKGLPSWEDLEAETEVVNEAINDLADMSNDLEALENTLALKISNNEPDTAVVRQQVDNLRAKINEKDAQITNQKKSIEKRAMLIIDFVKYHIQDNSIYVDNNPHKMTEGNNEYYYVGYETAALDNQTKRFSKVYVESTSIGADKDVNAHNYPDKYGRQTLTVKGDIDEIDNVCYVITTGKEGQDYNIMTRDIEFAGRSIETSSYAVVHQIDNYLVNDRIFKNGRFTTENE